MADVHSSTLKKALAQIPDANPEKGHCWHLDNTRPHLTDHEIQANNLARLSHTAYGSDMAPADFWLFGCLKVMLKGSSFETAIFLTQ
jgi:hypothetical protein